MNINVYKITCLTNMHVGSGDINYSIVDNEVMKDEILKTPIIPSSGIKGCLSSFCRKSNVLTKDENDKIFGKAQDSEDSNRGHVKFMNAELFARPMRLTCVEGSFKLVTSLDLISRFNSLITGLGLMKNSVLNGECYIPLKDTSIENFSENLRKIDIKKADNLLENKDNYIDNNSKLDIIINHLSIEKAVAEAAKIAINSKENGNSSNNEKNDEVMAKAVAKASAKAKKETENKSLDILASEICIMNHEDYKFIDLPVTARNKLDKNGTSENLWYEEYVPHDTIFYLPIVSENDSLLSKLDNAINGEIIQFGKNASIGFGLCKVEKIMSRKEVKSDEEHVEESQNE